MPAAGLAAIGLAAGVIATGLGLVGTGPIGATGLATSLLALAFVAAGLAVVLGPEFGRGSREEIDPAVAPPPLVEDVREGSSGEVEGRATGRPGGGVKFVERTLVLASGAGRASAAPPGRAGAVNPVDLAGSPSALLAGGGPPRACTGGGAAPGRSVSFSSPLFTPGAGRDSSFGPRTGGATGDPVRIVSCIRPELGRGVRRELSRDGGAGGATGAGPTLVISRVLAAGAGARESAAPAARESAAPAARDSAAPAAAEGRDSGCAPSFPAASPWTGRTARVTSLWVGRGGGPTRVISGGAGRDMPRVVSISACECGVNVRELLAGARLSEVTGCCGGTLGGRRFDGALLTSASLTMTSSSSSSTAIAGYDARDPAASSAGALSSADGLRPGACAGAASTAAGTGLADEGSEIRSAIGPGRWVCV